MTSSAFTRKTVRIPVEGADLEGWLYRPASAAPCPAVVMSGGYATVKELHTDRFAAVFAQAGLAVLLYDHRNFGGSGGSVRGEIDPWQQIRDMRDVITWVGLQDGIDSSRLGLWGSSYSGGHALVLGAADRRLRCVVSQVPTISGYQSFLRRVAPHLVGTMRAQHAADRADRMTGAEPRRRRVIPEGDDPGIYATPDAVAFYQAARTSSPHWDNVVTLRSTELSAEYEPAVTIERISPTPLLMIVAEQDTVTPTDLALSAYQRALEPKRLALIPDGHFDVYDRHFDRTSAEARDWFIRHLTGN